jgi:hypothetical protein
MRPPRRVTAALTADDAGLTSTSVAAVFFAVIVMTMLVVQAGLYYHGQHLAAAAADEAVAAARFGGDGVGAANEFLDAAPLEDPAVTPGGNPAETIQFTVTGTVDKVVPLPITFRVSATASAPVEQFVPEPDRD